LVCIDVILIGAAMVGIVILAMAMPFEPRPDGYRIFGKLVALAFAVGSAPAFVWFIIQRLRSTRLVVRSLDAIGARADPGKREPVRPTGR
jgi:hypothetical protein